MGIVPVRAARALGAPAEVVAAAALAVVVGHVFPIFFGFRGGKGVATGFGALLQLFPLSGLAALVIFLALVVSTRYVSLGSVASAASLPFTAWLFGRLGWAAPPGAVALSLVVATVAVVLGRHAGNLRRLLAGEERRLGEANR
jgi:glycerol-3-phosphate acyltransferase PlsY